VTDAGTTAPPAERHANYRYDRFNMKLLLQDLAFHRDALGPGDAMPEVALTDLDGGTVQTGGRRERPMLVVTGSLTCPMTSSSMPVVNRLYQEFGDRVDFVLMAAREAHPGEHFPQPRTVEEKVQRAHTLREHHDVPFAVAVDGIDGDLHRFLDGKPNAAFLVDTDGTIVFRAHWARDVDAIAEALHSVIGGETPEKPKSAAMMGPVMRAMGSVEPVMSQAGPGAHRDLWRSAFPMAMAGKVAKLFAFRHADHRGIAAAATLGIGMVSMVVVLVLVL
jgi:hypothetical protein